MKTYKIVDGSEGRKISFAITCGLSEGYGDSAKTHSVEDLKSFYKEWVEAKAASKQPFITGSIFNGTVVYGWAGDDGSFGSGEEPSAEFRGEFSHLYGKNFVENEELSKEVLNDLASFLGNKLGQTRVYVALGDKNWVLQAEETATPTGETV